MRIFIVEDHLMFREALRKVCERELGHTVVGENGCGAVALELILQSRPDVVLLDLVLTGSMDGIHLAEQLAQLAPSVRLLGISGYIDARTLHRIDHSHMHGFIDKGTNTAAALKEALAAVAAGKTYFSAAYRDLKTATQADPLWFARILSDTEQTVLGHIGAGLNDEEIGRALGISPTTAQTHRSRILKKLCMAGTPKLVAFAFRHGFCRPEIPPSEGS